MQSEILIYKEEGIRPWESRSCYAARTWGCMQWRWFLQKFLKLRRKMAAAAAGKKSTTSLSLFTEAFGLEVEDELSTMSTQTWAEWVWTGKWYTEQKVWREQIRGVQMW